MGIFPRIYPEKLGIRPSMCSDDKKLDILKNSNFGLADYLSKQYSSCPNQEPLGGDGKYIEIDESAITKQKHHRGRPRRGTNQWVFDGIESGEGGLAFAFHVENRKKRTQYPLIRKHILPKTRIISEDWPAYRKLGKKLGKPMGYKHYILTEFARQLPIMHNIWKISLFEKNPDMVICKTCRSIKAKNCELKIANHSVIGFVRHLKQHEEYKKIFDKLDGNSGEAVAMERFIRRPSDGLSSLDTKVINYVAENCISFNSVGSSSFVSLFSSTNSSEKPNKRRHYSDYGGIKSSRQCSQIKTRQVKFALIHDGYLDVSIWSLKKS